MTDLTTLTGEDLDALRRDVLAEQERRQALATVPSTVHDLSREFLAGGGDPAQLEAAITP